MKRLLILLCLLLTWASPGWTATTFLDPGTAATQGIELWTSTLTSSGTAASDAQAVQGSLRSIKANTTASTGYAAVLKTGIMADAGRRVSFYFRTTALPLSGTYDPIWIVVDGSAVEVLMVSVNSSGNLQIRNSTYGVVTTGASVLTINTDYRIAAVYTISGTNTNTVTVFLGGVQEITATNVTAGTGSDGMYLGRNLSGDSMGTGSNYFAHVYVDSGTSGDPGDIRVTAKRPATENTTNFDTAIGNARSSTDYNNVNERPLSLTNGWQHAATSDVQENYGLEAASVGDHDLTGATLISRCAWIYAKGAAGGAGTPKIMDNGTETAITLTSSATMFFVCSDSASYPSNAAGIGMRSTNNADDTFFYEAGTVIAYIPAAAPAVNFFRRRVQ